MFLDLRSITYHVDDLEKAKTWYGSLLGMEPTVHGPTYASFAVGSDRLGLLLVDKTAEPPSSGAVAYWAVSDIKAEYKRLIELGADEHRAIEHIGGGIHLATVRDPFGNLIGIGGMIGIPDNKNIETKPSQTALWTTLMRAYAAKEENRDIRGQDDLSWIFLPEEQRKALDDETQRRKIKENAMVIGVCEYVMARTRVFDHFFIQALSEGFEQIVLLGAGYDSRPYRFHDRIGHARIYELDVPATQDHKRQCLARADVDIPRQLTYVAINFNTQSLEKVLPDAGYDPAKKTFFLWEGVTYYLAPQSVDATLAFITSHAPTGSAVAFDYIELWPGVIDAYGVKELMAFNSARQSGEPGGTFTLEKDAIETFLVERGFKIVQHFNARQLEQEFLTLDDGRLFGHVTGHFRVAKAVSAG